MAFPFASRCLRLSVSARRRWHRFLVLRPLDAQASCALIDINPRSSFLTVRGATREPEPEGPVHIRGVLSLPADDAACDYAQRAVDPASHPQPEHRLALGHQSAGADHVLSRGIEYA